MWSHYAQEHKGICIEYDFSTDENILSLIEPVFYTNSLFNITSLIVKRNLIYADELLNQGIKANSVKIVTNSKAFDWSYEKEWRILFIPTSETKDLHYLNVSKPKAIFLGTYFSDNSAELKETFFRIVSELKIPTYPMKLHRSQYKIVRDIPYTP
jgi:hypothetical protein